MGFGKDPRNPTFENANKAQKAAYAVFPPSEISPGALSKGAPEKMTAAYLHCWQQLPGTYPGICPATQSGRKHLAPEQVGGAPGATGTAYSLFPMAWWRSSGTS